MTNYKPIGAHQVNKWLWSQLKNFEYKTGVKAFKDYKDSGNTSGFPVVPIIPGVQSSAFSDMTGNRSPFIVYNYITSGYTTEWWLCREQCAYVIYDNDEERLISILHYMSDLLKRMDWTARNINNSGLADPRFDMKYVQLTSSAGPDDYQVTTELSLRGAMLVINYEYTVDMDTLEGSGLRV
ncbi:hypothetical protein SEA_COMRADE_35 [Streptomyces phage Comrade]|uniref:Tail terminator n=3 Tax=Gilsonvirus comrade TaxID=2846395 RepID=A0A345MDW9_9CAUD|nr:hypothetical protein HWB84_gp211 [Streptomyces phage Comrade]AXH68750.1 hypothetical protein SEA_SPARKLEGODDESS_35 [Streptomyces phage SparkleGoddess]AXQ63308.1 hypothetical protein SEA_COMRADE_35 [Streptomyces phage Comrade]QQO39721.1 hypothetical protein SEA_BELFORT_36 [Streptomyces phage Belfort]